MLTFQDWVSGDVRDGAYVFRLGTADGGQYDFSITPHIAAMLVSAIQGGAKLLSEYSGPTMKVAGFQFAIGPDLNPVLMLHFATNLVIALALPPEKLADLKACISDIERAAIPGKSSH